MPPRDALQARLEAEVDGIATFGAAVTRDGELVLEHTADALSCACSTIKVPFAMAVMTLVEEGSLDLDAPVLELDPTLGFADRAHAAGITLRHLLSHTSGLGDTDRVEPDPREALSRLAVIAEPGRAFRYSNVAFHIALETAARVADRRALELLRERVLGPLGMQATWPDPRFTGGAFGEGSAFGTTARDLAKLADELMGGGRVLGAEARAEMARVHADSYTAAPNRYYGLGLSIERWDGHELHAHGGGLQRFGSAFVVDPEQRAAAAFIFDDPRGYAVSPHAYLDALLERESRPLPRREADADIRDYLGTFDNGATLFEEDGRPVLAWKGRRTPLHAVDERLFAGPDRISVGLLPGEPTMISVNDFILIGARPGVRVS